MFGSSVWGVSGFEVWDLQDEGQCWALIPSVCHDHQTTQPPLTHRQWVANMCACVWMPRCRLTFDPWTVADVKAERAQTPWLDSVPLDPGNYRYVLRQIHPFVQTAVTCPDECREAGSVKRRVAAVSAWDHVSLYLWVLKTQSCTSGWPVII